MRRPHSLVALAIGAAATEAGLGTGTLSTEASTLLSTSLGAAVGAVATYLGARVGAERPESVESPPYRPPEDEQTREWPRSSPDPQ